MANEEQLAILKQGVEVWNKWRREQGLEVTADLRDADLRELDLHDAILIGDDLSGAHLYRSSLHYAIIAGANFSGANLDKAELRVASCEDTNFSDAYLRQADLIGANLKRANLSNADLNRASLNGTNLTRANLQGSNLSQCSAGGTIFGDLDMRQVSGLDSIFHSGPSTIGTNTFAKSEGRIPEVFLRGCGLGDWEIEAVKLYNPDLSNQQINDIQYRMYDLRATQALQISPLFISYSRADGAFVDKLGNVLTQKGVRYWRDVHEMKAGRIEKQIDRAIRQNPTVLLVLSEHSTKSDWVEHEVRMARAMEKDTGRDIFCPVALDDSWQKSRWPQRLMEQIMEYNILDFSAWQDDSKFDDMFSRLIDGLELFYRK